MTPPTDMARLALMAAGDDKPGSPTLPTREAQREETRVILRRMAATRPGFHHGEPVRLIPRTGCLPPGIALIFWRYIDMTRPLDPWTARLIIDTPRNLQLPYPLIDCQVGLLVDPVMTFQFCCSAFLERDPGEDAHDLA